MMDISYIHHRKRTMPTNATDSAESLAPEESAKAASNQVAELAATIAEKIRGWTFPEGCSIPKDTPVEVLEALSRHQDEDVRAEI